MLPLLHFSFIKIVSVVKERRGKTIVNAANVTFFFC